VDDSPIINIGFVLTSLSVGGQERGLLKIISKLNFDRFRPFVYCLKDPGRLRGDVEAAGAKVAGPLSTSKWDLRSCGGWHGSCVPTASTW